jgi:NAD+ synthase (glutamine-hydrolysing)
VIEAGGDRCLLTICEDIWVPAGRSERWPASGAPASCSISRLPRSTPAAPAERHAAAARFARARPGRRSYVNLVGGQDELVFDGGSFVMAADGRIAAAAQRF